MTVPDGATVVAYGILPRDFPVYRTKPKLTPEVRTEEHDGVNVELLEDVMNWIEKNPTTWKQSAWFEWLDTETGDRTYGVEEFEVEEVNTCGTAFCFAGHVALREGFPNPPVDNNSEWSRPIAGQDYMLREDVASFAAKRLGLNHDVADVLFKGDNDLTALRKMVEEIKENPDVTSWELEDLINDWDDDEDEFYCEECDEYHN